ncbi:sensor domain-containing protein [Mycolicibacterium sp. BiH015]|uniref:sensor domain-containing protein n=1 Tax=Mycolicibacterium sp. BiH015 TaxID=3018808 RepID=UPI0022DE9FC7|nr:sensor domain-containing protein [Mycolicibacterium sp. BiH015]MDA2890186.1 sensor domain-containing protein [Mycolicibacterium sp. BiH015]
MSVSESVARRCAFLVGVFTAASVLITGCVSTTVGQAVRGHGAGSVDVPPLDEAELDEILLTIGEINGILGSTQMKVTSELDEMTDNSEKVSDPDCLGAVYGAEAPVYEGTDWTAVRDQVAREPGEDNDHWVEQTAVLYPAEQNAQDFFDRSLATWQDCANDAIVVGEGEYIWELGDVSVDDTLITQMTTQEGADGWACQHALSFVSNVTVEAWACGYDITDEAAEIADAMIANAAQ